MCAYCFARLSFDTKPRCLVCGLSCLDGFTHPKCRRRHEIDGVFSSIAYKGVAKKLLYVFKYKPHVTVIQNLLGDLFYEGLIQNESFMSTIEQYSKTITFVPIPLHSLKLKSRGYNQSEILATELAKRFDLPVKNLLQRTKKTESQYGLKKEERKDNITGAFSLSPNILVSQYPNIFVVDDILTTGATLFEAGRVLKKAGAKQVWGLTFAQD